MAKRRALITGVTGQDGALLARFLLKKNYEVFGTSRDAQIASVKNFERLKIENDITLISLALGDFRGVIQAIKAVQPTEIYHLAGQSSVGLSFEQPMETYDSVTRGTLNLLEAIRFLESDIRFYHASSSECFGESQGLPSNENSPFHPRSPYAVAKAAAFWTTVNYRESYNIFASNGILFNHDSPLRPDRFVTQKIIRGARAIKSGKIEFLEVGNIDIVRDWGWADDYVEAKWKILQHSVADDFVVATGESHSLREFIEEVFLYFNIDPNEKIKINPRLFRPNELKVGAANPHKINQTLNWKAKRRMKEVIVGLVEEDLGM